MSRCSPSTTAIAVLGLLAAIAPAELRAQEAGQPAAETSPQQDPAPSSAQPAPAEPEVTQELPEIEVSTEADRPVAKRNKKKQALRRASGTRVATPSAAPAPPAAAPQATDDAAAAATAPGGPAQDTVSVPGIVLEGEKALRTLSDTTTSIGVVTGAQIKTQQIQDLQEALNNTVNVIAPEGSRGNSGISIRGINSEGLTQQQNSAAAPVISVNIDGATQNPEATRRGARALWDIEQVEVLRGPQSTLQSRNSLAGSVFIKTNDPRYVLESVVEGSFGSNDLKVGGFVLNAPIVANQVALRVAGQLAEGDKGIDYTDRENDALDEERLANIRAKLLVEPDSISGLSALFTVARTEDRPAVTSVTGPDFSDRVFSLGTSAVDFRQTDTDNYISDIAYQISPAIKFRSVTAYAGTFTEVSTAAGSSLQRIRDERDGGDFTQDLRIEIDKNSSGISGVAGFFYGQFENSRDALLDQDFGRAFDFLGIFPPGFFVTIQDLDLQTKTTSVAGYADLRYRFLEKFELQAGGRILRDDVKTRSRGEVFDFDAFITGLGGGTLVLQNAPANSATDVSFTEVLPKAGLSYDLTGNQTIGATFTQGYRAGFTEVTTTGFNTVNPEFLDAYEISYRSQWFGRSLDFNANAFYYDYSDQQVAVEDPVIPGFVTILNAASSHAYGAEFDVRWRPNAAWQLFAGVGILKTQFDDFDTAEGNFSGNEYPEAPGVTIVAGAHYKDPTGWFAGANIRYIDGYFSNADLGNDPLRFVDSYTVVDARVGYEWDAYTLTLFAKNLFGEDYLTSRSQLFPPDPPEATIGDERLVGVTLTGRF
jgi:iron complex outermembrane recepter protein